MPEISIILPSLREKLALETIKEFEITNKDFDYEIVIISPFPVKREKIVHVFEEKPQGVSIAYNAGYKCSSGKYICWWSDDAFPTKGCLLNMVNFLKTKKPPFIGAFGIKDKKGIEHPQWKAYGKLYACWGCASRETIEMVGGFFDPIYKCYFADPDLGLRVWEKGGRVEVCPDAWLISHGLMDKLREDNQIRYFEKDMNAFFDRWHDKFGKRIKKDFYIVNRPAFEYEGIIKIFPKFFRPILIKVSEIIYSQPKLRSTFLWQILRKIKMLQ